MSGDESIDRLPIKFNFNKLHVLYLTFFCVKNKIHDNNNRNENNKLFF